MAKFEANKSDMNEKVVHISRVAKLLREDAVSALARS